MKKFLRFFSLVALVLVVSACGGTKDGSFQAMESAPSNGWSYFLTYDVVDGKMTNFNYDAVSLQTGSAKMKSELSKAGAYKLAPGNAGEWHEQAAVIEKWLETNQGLGDVTFDEEGKTDAVAGATIHFNNVKTLLDAAAANGPVTKGELKDGVYFAKSGKDENGFVNTFGYFVNNGVILGALGDAFQMAKVDGTMTAVFKTTLAADGKYDLGEEAVAPYADQIAAISTFVVENQGFGDITVNEEGKTDAISGATIGVKAWVELFKKAELQ